MSGLTDEIRIYQQQLNLGHIQKAYRGILLFLSRLKADLDRSHGDFYTSALYAGYMDMSYFACTPKTLKEKQLKIAVVYLHGAGRFEAWLSAGNRKIQAEYVSLLSRINLHGNELSLSAPGADSILSRILESAPDFDAPQQLSELLEERLLQFIEDVTSILSSME